MWEQIVGIPSGRGEAGNDRSLKLNEFSIGVCQTIGTLDNFPGERPISFHNLAGAIAFQHPQVSCAVDWDDFSPSAPKLAGS